MKQVASSRRWCGHMSEIGRHGVTVQVHAIDRVPGGGTRASGVNLQVEVAGGEQRYGTISRHKLSRSGLAETDSRSDAPVRARQGVGSFLGKGSPNCLGLDASVSLIER